MLKKTERRYRKPWPKDCVWPEPLYDGCGMMWEADFVDETLLDEEGLDLAKNILNGLNIDTNGDNKGIYASYENFPYLVISKLKYSQDSTYKYIAEIFG
jgi:hypothetical protein